MKLPTLYSRTSTGAVQQWTIEIDGDKYRATYGQIGGKQTTTQWTKTLVTNEGRSNQRTPEEQAIFQAQALWQKRTEVGYHVDQSKIDTATFIEPMLAKSYDDPKRKESIEFPIYCQPKLDGIRCLITSTAMWSRNGKQIVGAPHVLEYLQQNFFNNHPDVILDGELYCDKFANDFNEICSRVKKTKPTKEDLVESAKSIQYWCYDIVDTEKTFFERNKFIIQNLPIFDNIIIYVDTKRPGNQQELDDLYEEYVDKGYEGQMIRFNEVYQQKRSSYLLKRKEFQDREYIIQSVEEGQGNKTGMAGCMILINDDGSTFRSNIKGSHTYLKEIWQDPQSYVGRKATCKFFHLTPAGVPRFPYVIKVREDFDI